jgi:FKBP-type peptidyl-prolyl cis-trans isomerase FkpA
VSARSRALALALLAVCGCPASQPGDPPPPPAPRVDLAHPDDPSLYALGAWLARNLAGIQVEERDLAPLAEGLSDALLGRPRRVDPTEVAERVQLFLNERRAVVASREKRAGAGLLDAARAEAGARRTVNGAIVVDLVPGTGATPSLPDTVKIHHRGMRRDGSVFDDSYAPTKSGTRKQPSEFRLTAVIPCWADALQQMKVGGRARVTCKSDLAYGDRGLPGVVLPGASLQFELELPRETRS